MKQWYQSLDSRERRSVQIAAVALALLIIYLIIWVPLHNHLEKTQKTNQELQDQYSWMQHAAVSLRQTKQQPSGARGQPLLTLIDQSAKRANIRNAIQQMKPQQNNQVQLWLESAKFDTLLGWLVTLQQQNQVRVQLLNIRSTKATGLVDARITLGRET